MTSLLRQWSCNFAWNLVPSAESHADCQWQRKGQNWNRKWNCNMATVCFLSLTWIWSKFSIPMIWAFLNVIHSQTRYRKYICNAMAAILYNRYDVITLSAIIQLGQHSAGWYGITCRRRWKGQYINLSKISAWRPFGFRNRKSAVNLHISTKSWYANSFAPSETWLW